MKTVTVNVKEYTYGTIVVEVPDNATEQEIKEEAKRLVEDEQEDVDWCGGIFYEYEV